MSFRIGQGAGERFAITGLEFQARLITADSDDLISGAAEAPDAKEGNDLVGAAFGQDLGAKVRSDVSVCCGPGRFVARHRREAFTIADPDRTWTVREIARHAAIGGRSPVIIGSGAEVARQLQEWTDETGVDGFNCAYAVTPGSFADIADLVVPELQERGAFKRDYAPGTFREKLYGHGPRLPDSHPAGTVRRNGVLG